MKERKPGSGCLACKAAGTRPKGGTGVRIVFDPGIQMTGTPTIEGHRLAAEHMAGRMFELGESAVIDDYDLTPEELLAACWWAAKWGPRKYKKAWKEWGDIAGHHLWYQCINVPYPPTRTELAAAQGTDAG